MYQTILSTISITLYPFSLYPCFQIVITMVCAVQYRYFVNDEYSLSI